MEQVKDDGRGGGDVTGLDRGFAHELRRATEAAACAAFHWVGRGEKEKGDGAAVDAMRIALAGLPIDATVVIGEGEKDDAPHLFNGERVGRPDATFKADLAVDPVEGTSYLAAGVADALAVLAIAPRGAMFDPGPAFYMEKLVVSGRARGVVDPEAPTAHNLRAVAGALDKDLSGLTVYVLDKPRHNTLIDEIHGLGAKVALHPAGDVAGALAATLPDSGIDVLMGTGGTPEGILAACAVAALDGVFYGRLDPQFDTEIKAVADAGLSTTTWNPIEELVSSPDVFFCATGITSGLLVDGVEETPDGYRTETFMTAAATRERHVLTTWTPADAVPQALPGDS